MEIRCQTAGCGGRLLVEDVRGTDYEIRVRCKRCKEVTVVSLKAKKGPRPEVSYAAAG